MMLLLVEFACTPAQMPVIHGLEFFNRLNNNKIVRCPSAMSPDGGTILKLLIYVD